MPLNSPSKSLYPTSQLQGLDESKNFSYKQDKKKYKYIAADLQTNSLIQKKRKFVSLEFSQDLNKLLVVKHGHKSFMDSSTSGGKSINEKHLVLYVKGNEQDQCFNEMQQILNDSFDLELDKRLEKIKSHFKKVWANIKEFDNYGDMKHAFDEKTGEYIDNSVNDLGKTYRETEKKYKQLIAKEAVFEEEKKILDEMKEILDKMEVIYNKNRSDFQHLSTNTVTPVAQSFKKLVSEFEGNIQQLEVAKSNNERSKQLKLFKDKLITFQTDCEEVIPVGAACTEEMFEERKEIKKEIDCLFVYINELIQHAVSDATITGLDDKFNNLENKLSMFKDKVHARPIESQNNNEKENEQRRQMENYFIETLQPKLTIITNHAHKTSPEKMGILNNILQYISELKEIIANKASIGIIKDKIKNIKIFINDNITKLSISTGVFFKPVSPGLVIDLSSKLDYLVPETIVNDQEQGFVLRS